MTTTTTTTIKIPGEYGGEKQREGIKEWANGALPSRALDLLWTDLQAQVDDLLDDGVNYSAATGELIVPVGYTLPDDPDYLPELFADAWGRVESEWSRTDY